MQALSKNGKVFGNGIMVGVQQCIDKVSDLLNAHVYKLYMYMYTEVLYMYKYHL